MTKKTRPRAYKQKKRM